MNSTREWPMEDLIVVKRRETVEWTLPGSGHMKVIFRKNSGDPNPEQVELFMAGHGGVSIIFKDFVRIIQFAQAEGWLK